ncbi:MAG TPA: hypothetical protein VKR27_03660 [Acidimicrobiales bacterium]|nr:hypothetical protein [Acidimicrobiales bacterium]
MILVVAAGFLMVSAAVHLQLWTSGYRGIPTIGTLFFAQVIATPAVALLLTLTRWVVAVVAAIATMVGTVGGFILADTIGLFGFHDGFAAPFASTSVVVEGTAILLLLVGATIVVRRTLKDHAPMSRGEQLEGVFDLALNQELQSER